MTAVRILSIYLLLGLGSAVLAAMLTPLVARASLLLGLVDAPGGRKVHAESVPRLGGLAIVVASILGMILALALAPGRPAPDIWTTLRPLLLAGGLIFLVGLLDDVRGVGPGPKLAIELVAALIVMSSGLLIQTVTLLGVSWHLGWLAWPVTVVWLVGLTNAFNLIDGIDGLAAGIAVIAGGACGAILVVRGHAAEATLLAAVVGAALGFLIYNFAPASIFLGDCGSLVIGFILAATAIAGWQKGATALAAGVPLLIFALPIADSAGTLIRRSFSRGQAGPSSIATVLRQLAEPDREHIHHRLVGLGWSTRRTRVDPVCRDRRALDARAGHGARRYPMRRVLLVQPSMQPPGGGNGVAAWVLQALVGEHDVTVLSWTPVEVDAINRFFGTHLQPRDFKTLLVPRGWVRIVDRLPVPATLVKLR